MSHQQSDLTGLAVDDVGMRLLRAAEELRRNGWCQGAFENDDGSHCGVGAIIAAHNRSISSACLKGLSIAENAALSRVCNYLGKQSLMAWNDAPGRTVDDVLAALTAAALSRAAQG